MKRLIRWIIRNRDNELERRRNEHLIKRGLV
jgi:hypothetical protein